MAVSYSGGMRRNLVLLCIVQCMVLSAAYAADPRIATAKKVAQAVLPSHVAARLAAAIDTSPTRFLDLVSLTEAESKAIPDLLVRVDKQEALPASYVPPDLVSLDGSGLSLSKKGLALRRPAYDALKAMSTAARAQGVTLLVS